jgi:hypothetical protein
MTDRYGGKGCLCFCDEGRWMPNARCPHHGLLADFTDRRETGTYRVIKVEPEDRTVRPEPDCEACAEYGECLDCEQAREEEADAADVAKAITEDPDVARALLPPSAFGLDVPDVGPADCSWGRPYACRVHCPPPESEDPRVTALRAAGYAAWNRQGKITTEEESGVLATVRRWIRGLWAGADGLADD